MLHIQILALSLIPLLSGGLPKDRGVCADPLAILGIEASLTRDFLIGTWRHADHFSRWGITDKNRTRVKRSAGTALMTLNADGTIRMVNFFRPETGRWEFSRKGILIYDPRHPERGSQILRIMKRGDNRIWLLLPFAGGSAGVGLERVTDRYQPSAPRTTHRSANILEPIIPVLPTEDTPAILQPPHKEKVSALPDRRIKRRIKNTRRSRTRRIRPPVIREPADSALRMSPDLPRRTEQIDQSLLNRPEDSAL